MSFSKYHFHRLFTAYTGLSLQKYIRWLRLKRAAHQLILEKDKLIIDIAIDAGFDSHESFTRAFKQSCGMSPSQFRVVTRWHNWDNVPYCLPKNGDVEMNVEIRNIEPRRLAVVEHRGDPLKIGESVNKLIGWAKAQVTNLKPKPGEAFAYVYDDPDITPPDDFRQDFAMTIPHHLKVTEDVIERTLPGGRYAVVMHKGSRENIGETVYSLYRDWLPQSGEELADLPCIFAFYNFDNEVPETEALTECRLLLK